VIFLILNILNFKLVFTLSLAEKDPPFDLQEERPQKNIKFLLLGLTFTYYFKIL
jgi:hypothetical protein